MIQILIKKGRNKGNKVNLPHFPISIGSDASNTLVLDDPLVSLFHIKIKKRGRLHILEDLDSHEGCHLNGERVVNSIIQNGDSILIGDTELLVSLANTSIDFSEILNFNMVLDQDHGIEGPITVGKNAKMHSLGSMEPNQSMILKENIRSFKKLYDLHGNIMVIDSLEEACGGLLRGFCQLSDQISRCAAFIWSESQRQFIPAATKYVENEDRPFHISKRAFSEAVALKKPIHIKEDHKLENSAPTNRYIIPMIYHGEIIGLFHLESDRLHKKFPQEHLENIQAFISLCAPNLESILLRIEIDSMMLGIVETVVATIEAKDTYTVGHSERVCKYSMAIADELKLNKDVKKMLMISSLCHDIGKIGIPDAILKKVSLLSREEYEEMKLHPTIGANIISHIPNAKSFLSGVKYHHEKWDGTGYPEGLIGENIPFFGRIVAVADVFDAMISGRAYSGFIDESDAIQKIQDEIELFDPEIIKALVKAWDSGRITQRTSTTTFSEQMKARSNSDSTKKKK